MRFRAPSSISAVILLICCLSCGGGADIGGLRVIHFSAEDNSCDNAEVTWRDKTDTQHDMVQLPWSASLHSVKSELTIEARRSCDDDGTITVEIYIDGRRSAVGTAAGSHAIARAATWVD